MGVYTCLRILAYVNMLNNWLLTIYIFIGAKKCKHLFSVGLSASPLGAYQSQGSFVARVSAPSGPCTGVRKIQNTSTQTL